ncbi:MAG: ribonuclease HII [Panacagrimonas sp.]
MKNDATHRIAGVDEVGRGCLAGPVYAAAVILGPAHVPSGLDDSKKLSANKRKSLDEEIRHQALAWSLAFATTEEIDRINILQASLLAMQRAVQALSTRPDHVLVDGNRTPALEMPCRCVIGGDQSEPSIMAASILAKVARDAQMQHLEQRYPGYGLAQHKGYPTPAHRKALRELGASPIHRMSFAPCREAVAGNWQPETGN